MLHATFERYCVERVAGIPPISALGDQQLCGFFAATVFSGTLYVAARLPSEPGSVKAHCHFIVFFHLNINSKANTDSIDNTTTKQPHSNDKLSISGKFISLQTLYVCMHYKNRKYSRHKTGIMYTDHSTECYGRLTVICNQGKLLISCDPRVVHVFQLSLQLVVRCIVSGYTHTINPLDLQKCY